MIFAAILAGGKGTRVGANVPKQFIELNGKMILMRTLDVFIQSHLFDEIYISVNEMWLDFTSQALKDYYSETILKKIHLINGGEERIMSFLNIVEAIKEKYGAKEDDIVISHDSVRPFVTCEMIEDSINKTKLYKVAMAVTPSVDTTYLTQKEGFATSTYDRKKLCLGQTPEGCNMKFLYEIIHSYSHDELLKTTGTSQLFINKGVDVKISMGSPNNIKITTMKDIECSDYLFRKED